MCKSMFIISMKENKIKLNLPFSRLTGKVLTSVGMKLCSCPASTGWKNKNTNIFISSIQFYVYHIIICIIKCSKTIFWFIKQMTFSIYFPSGLKRSFNLCLLSEKDWERKYDGLQTERVQMLYKTVCTVHFIFKRESNNPNVHIDIID